MIHKNKQEKWFQNDTSGYGPENARKHNALWDAQVIKECYFLINY